MKYLGGKIFQGDCLEVMKKIPDQSIDMILCDLPYGTTCCSWDAVIPFEKLWAEYAVGMYSRVAVYWSPLLKKYCGIADKTDEELLQGSTDEAILGVPKATYRSIANYRYQPVILELVEKN